MKKNTLDQKSIISRKKLASEISKIASQNNLKTDTGKKKVLEEISKVIREGKIEIKKRFEKSQNGLEAANLNSFLTDQIIRTLYELASLHVYRATNPTKTERLSIIAVGGYGRSELAPYSDIDLLFLHPYKLTVWCEQVIEFILYSMWDLGFNLGQSVRNIKDCIKITREDHITNTGILESRFVCGDKKLYEDLSRNYFSEIIFDKTIDFVKKKIDEKEKRHKKFGDSRYLVEPNIKEGKGGIRDLQTIFWIEKYNKNTGLFNREPQINFLTQQEINKFNKAKVFFWTIRFWLHYIAERSEERLTFDYQVQISKKLNFRDRESSSRVERFMKKYYLMTNLVGSLSRIYFSSIFSTQLSRKTNRLPKINLIFKNNRASFLERDNKLYISDESVIFEDPMEIINVFAISQSYDKEIHPKTLTNISRNLYRISRLKDKVEANSIFINILTSRKNPENILRKMNETGFLGRFIPEFARVVAQTQHDMYHLYTVDEHTIRAIGVLNKIESGELSEKDSFASTVIKKVSSRKVLYLAVLLHDIAKGQNGDHSKNGEKIALNLCPRLGLDKEETDEVAWLVRWHLLMSHTAFKRDISDTKTIKDFATFIEKEERLKLLYLLTISDISAVGPNTWNAWKGQLLRNLYESSNASISGYYKKSIKERNSLSQKKLKSLLPVWSDDQFNHFTSLHYEHYWSSLDVTTQVRHAEIIKSVNFSNQDIKIDFYIDKINAITEITIYAPDHSGLFSRVAGSLSIAGATVLDAKVSTTNHGMALDTFWVQNSQGSPFSEEDELKKLFYCINKGVNNNKWIINELKNKKLNINKKNKLVKIETNVSINNNASKLYTIIEVTTRDKIGLLHDLTEGITKLDLQISSAHISTYGQRAVDVFYIKDIYGLKITNKRKVEKIINFIKDKIDKKDKKGIFNSKSNRRVIAA